MSYSQQPVSLSGSLTFKIRFNTQHEATGLYWRIIVNGAEYLATNLRCNVPTYSESSFDEKAGALKWHIAGHCSSLTIDDQGNTIIS